MDSDTLINPVPADEATIDTCVVHLSSPIRRALEVSIPKSRTRADPRPPIPACSQDEIRLKNRLRRQWKITRDPTLMAEVKSQHRKVLWISTECHATLVDLKRVLWKFGGFQQGVEIVTAVTPG